MAEPTRPAKADKPTDWALIKRVWPYIRADKAWLWVVLVATPLGVLSGVFQPVLLKAGIDDHIAVGDISGLTGVALGYLGVVIAGWLTGSLGFFALQRLSLRGLARLRTAIFAHVTEQGARFFDRRTTGSLMTRTVNDTEAVYESLVRGAGQLLTDFLTIIGMLVAMFALEWRLTLVAFAFSPLIWVTVGWFRRRLRPLSLAIRQTLSRLNGFFAEQIYGMSLVQLYGAQDKSRARFDEMSHAYMRAYHRSNWLDAGLYAVMDGMSALAIGAVVWFTAVQFTDPAPSITIGLLVAFVDYLGRIFVPIREFAGRIAALQQSSAALERIFGLMDAEDKVAPGHVAPETLAGAVRFDGVGFAYAADRPQVLDDVSFAVSPGEVVALVGATGSGKTTIGKLLTRMYDGYGGSITVDGHELSDLRLDVVRDRITVVHQDVYLFDGTVAENIHLWKEDLDDAALRRAVELSRAATFIDEQPQGLEWRLTERGSNLSTGQRQLLAIARAMARDASIVILDEATASVDSETEKLIDEAVAELFKQRTVLVIAHRLSTIQKADRIVVLHHGRVVEQGSHDELMATDGRYRLLVETGFEL
ncbi:MAG: ABC transporter ATP-binding protein [Deltaproteobacteria bacterium]|nr:MAG: ABC transporter ATP-binding protein [Deltaproteobacteria bacterium]